MSKANEPASKTVEYKNGYDCGKNGANSINCAISNFRTQQSKNLWQLGYDKAKSENLNPQHSNP